MKKKKTHSRFKMAEYTFGYSKTYRNARNYVRRMFLHPDKLTLNQKDEILSHYNINKRKLEEIIAWCLDSKRKVKH